MGRFGGEQSSVRTTTASSQRTASATPNLKPVMIPSIKPTMRPISTAFSLDSPVKGRRTESPLVMRREQRMSVDLGALNIKDSAHPRSTSELEDEIDVLEDQNESLIQKLRVAEDKIEKSEARAKQLEKQVSSFSGSIVEPRHVNRKEAAVPQREPSFRAPAQYNVTKNENLAALTAKAKIARNEAAIVADNLNEAGDEIMSLKKMAQKMTLLQEEMEEVVMKRCWLARYWTLCVQHGIHADIAEAKQEFWTFSSKLPLEIVLSAGQKAREGSTEEDDLDQKSKPLCDIDDLDGETNIESMLLVEKGLRELCSLKVEEAVLLAMAQHRRGCVKLSVESSGADVSNEGQNMVEAFELSKEETEDVLFKQAWLTYFWRRVKNHELEEDIAEERLKFWIEQSNHSPNSHDAVQVERGLLELKKLGIEFQLWEATRILREYDEDS